MKQKLLTLMCLALCYSAEAQFFNQGGTVVIESGAKLVVETDIVNTSSGTITNNGVIEVEGDFDNSAGTLTSTATSELKFVGAGDSELTAGTHTIHKLTLAKDAGANVVVMSDDVTVADDITFMNDNNKLILGNNDLIIEKSAQLLSAGMMSADDNEYIVTNGTGKVTAEGVGASAHTYPVGNSTTTYNPITITENGTADDISVRVLADAYQDGPAATTAFTSDVVGASWDVSEATAGGSDLHVSVQWAASDELAGFDRTDAGVARFDGTKYDLLAADLGAAAGSDPYTRDRSGTEPGLMVVGADAVMDFVALSPVAILGGAYNGTDMRDDLRSLSSFPTADPYPAAPYNYTHVGRGDKSPDVTPAQLAVTGSDAIVDWIFLELRDKTDNTNVIATKSIFVQKDGDIVEADGSAVKFRGVAADDYFVVVKHRNHLGVMTAATVTGITATPQTVDFTSVATFGTNAQQNVSGTNVMWGGDGTGDGQVRDNAVPSDQAAVASAVLGHPSNVGFFGSGAVSTFTGFSDAYEIADINMDGLVRDNALPSDAALVASLVLGHPANTGFFGSGAVSTFLGLVAQLP